MITDAFLPACVWCAKDACYIPSVLRTVERTIGICPLHAAIVALLTSNCDWIVDDPSQHQGWKYAALHIREGDFTRMMRNTCRGHQTLTDADILATFETTYPDFVHENFYPRSTPSPSGKGASDVHV